MTVKRALIASTALTSIWLAAAPAQAQEVAQEIEVEELVVVGSYIRRPDQANTASPIEVVGNEELQAIGASTVAELIQTLTINTGSQNNPDAFTQNFSTGTSNINLRGLGVGSTLVLLNGRRQVVSGAATDDGINFVDTASLVPLIAVDNIEILKDGGAALYGTDAVAGVVNFKTRDRFEGLEIRGEYQGAVNGDGDQTDYRLEVIGGVQTDRAYGWAAVSYLDRSPLTTLERRLSFDSITEPGGPIGPDVSSIGSPGTFVPLSRPTVEPFGTLFDALVGAGQAPLFADPNCGAGENSIPPAGILGFGIPPGVVGLCQLDFGEFFNLVPEETRLQGYGKIGYELTDTIDFFAELGFARNRANRNNSPTFPILTPQLVAGTNPFNPFGADLIFIGRPIGEGEPVESDHDSDTFRFVAGFTGQFGDNWFWDLSFTRAQNDFTVSARDALADRFFAALSGFGGEACPGILSGAAPGVGPCSYFNPFGTKLLAGPGETVIDPVTGQPVPVANDPALVEDFTAFSLSRFDSNLTVIDAVVSGTFDGVVELPGGAPGIAIGFQYREETYGLDVDENSNSGNFLFLSGAGTSIGDFGATRDIFAGFGELLIPAFDWLEIQAAVRVENVEGVDTTVDPKVSALITPLDNLSIRGSWGTSFRAPSIFQLESEGIVTLAQLFDPLVGNTAFLANFTLGNPDLEPEESRAFNIGVTYEPIEALTLSFDYWNFEFEDVIVQTNAQSLLLEAGEILEATGDPSALFNPAVFVRPLGAALPLLSQVNTQFVNADSIETSGFDFSARYEVDTDVGLFAPSFQGTYILNYDVFDPSLGEEIDGEGNRNFTNIGDPTPRLRFNAGLNWLWGIHSANVFVRYIGGFDDDQLDPTIAMFGVENGFVDSQTTLDVQYNIALSDFVAVDELVFTVGSTNITNEDPPFVNTNGGFESRVHDPRGRLVYVQLRLGF
ncbi:MAG: TonB-dependent receptor plug domain-containing protein [Rhodothalassiaceae bacterium]